MLRDRFHRVVQHTCENKLSLLSRSDRRISKFGSRLLENILFSFGGWVLAGVNLPSISQINLISDFLVSSQQQGVMPEVEGVDGRADEKDG